MEQLGYKTHLIGKICSARTYSVKEVFSFEEMNRKAKSSAIGKLKLENFADYERRQIQENVLKNRPILLTSWEVEDISNNCSQVVDENMLDSDLHTTKESIYVISKKRQLRYGISSQKGYYLYNEERENQDTFLVCETHAPGANPFKWFSIFDGHGPEGHRCSQFVADYLPKTFENKLCTSPLDNSTPMLLAECFSNAQQNLVSGNAVECSRSGTTATSMLVASDGTFLVANLGDSSCIVGTRQHDGEVLGRQLTTSHDLSCKEELERVKRAGAEVMSFEEKEGLESVSNPVLRVWHADPEKSAGTTFTRSIGDTLAHDLGVISHPEITEHSIGNDDVIFILCSDGVTKWIDPTSCCSIAKKITNPSKAAEAIVKEARKMWSKKSDYMDDVTAIVIFVEDTEEREKHSKRGTHAFFWTFFAGAASGFLGKLEMKCKFLMTLLTLL